MTVPLPRMARARSPRSTRPRAGIGRGQRDQLEQARVARRVEEVGAQEAARGRPRERPSASEAIGMPLVLVDSGQSAARSARASSSRSKQLALGLGLLDDGLEHPVRAPRRRRPARVDVQPAGGCARRRRPGRPATGAASAPAPGRRARCRRRGRAGARARRRPPAGRRSGRPSCRRRGPRPRSIARRHARAARRGRGSVNTSAISSGVIGPSGRYHCVNQLQTDSTAIDGHPLVEPAAGSPAATPSRSRGAPAAS